MALSEHQKRNAERNRRYWAEREAEALKNRITDEKEYDKRIRQIHQEMLDACQKEIESFYARYAKAEGITIAEAKKRVSKHDVKAFERKAAKYVKEKNFSKKANEELRLYNATMRINRMEMLKANLGLELIAGHDELEKFMGGILKGRTMEELERQAGILGKTVKNNAEKANSIVNGSFHNGKFSDRIWQYQDLMRQDLGKLLQQGMIQGKGARELTKDLRKYLVGEKEGKGATYNVERLMRTELARVQTEAQKQSYLQNGVDYYIFIANKNPSKHGTCEICQSLASKEKFAVEDMMPGDNAPPVHPHCRCSTAPYVNRRELDEILDYVDQGGTYEDWNNYKKTVENSQKGSKIKLGIQFFARSSKDYKTVELPKQEYAHVMSELATHLTATQRKQKVITKAIGKYIYTIENNGFGNYRVIGKEIIDNDIFGWWED
jgi:SPP1 gp7 family putative phage head morphogenesis protein